MLCVVVSLNPNYSCTYFTFSVWRALLLCFMSFVGTLIRGILAEKFPPVPPLVRGVKREAFFHMTEEKQMELMEAISKGINNDFKTPTISVAMNMNAITEIIENGEHDVMEDDRVIKFSTRDYNALILIKNNVSDSCDAMLRRLNSVILNMTLNEIGTDIGHHKISDAVSKAIEEVVLPAEQLDKIEVDIEDDFEYYGSEYLLKHGISNIIENAFRFGIASRPDGVVKIYTEEGDVLVIRDNGPGIAPEKLILIFEPFYTTSKTAMGLGLTFCKRVAVGKGSIECRSEVGEYSEFRLKLKLDE